MVGAWAKDAAVLSDDSSEVMVCFAKLGALFIDEDMRRVSEDQTMTRGYVPAS